MALDTNDFRIGSIEIVDGKPKVEWEPKVNRRQDVGMSAVLARWIQWWIRCF